MLQPVQIFMSPRLNSPRPGAKPQCLPLYLGDGAALYFSSYISSWKKSPQWSSISITSFLHSPCLPFLVTHWWPIPVPSECTLWQGTATLCSLNWFLPCPYLHTAYAGDFHQLTSLQPRPLPPPPQEITAYWGTFSSWINVKLFSVWYQVAAAPFPLGWELCICAIFILCWFSWQMAYFLLLGWHGRERKGVTLRACSAW